MTNQFLTVDEIQKKYGIKDFELFAEIKNGLPVYSKADLEKPLEEPAKQVYIDENALALRKLALKEYYRKALTQRNPVYIVYPDPYHIKDCLFLAQDLETRGLKPQNTPEPATNTGKTAIFPIDTPDGTRWETLFLTVRNYEITEIRHPGGTIINKRHAEMGLTEVAGRPIEVAKLYFGLALRGGELKPAKGTKHIKQTVSLLRKALQALFPGITGDPLPYNKGQWGTAFTLKADRAALLDTIPGSTDDKKPLEALHDVYAETIAEHTPRDASKLLFEQQNLDD